MMTNTLKDAADSAIETVSSLVHDARDQLDHFSLPTAHRTTRRPWWAVGLVAVVVLVAIAGIARRRGAMGSSTRGSGRREWERPADERRTKDDLHEVA